MTQSQFKRGAAALGALSQSGGESAPKAEITKFKSGTTLKVRVKGPYDLVQYFAYGIFGKVNTFIAKNPPERNARGFVTGNPTPWDRASQYYYDLASKDSANADEYKNLGYQFKGKERFLMGFANLETGEDIVVDLTKAQAQGIYETILEYCEKDTDGNVIDGGEHEFKDMAFKLSKKGTSTSTSVTLAPIINLAKGLTDEERKNFEATADSEFDASLFDSVLYESDEEEMIKALVKADFDISLLGLSIGGNSAQADEDVTPIGDETNAEDYDF